MPPIIATQGLTKYYGSNPGLVDLDLEVESGRIFGFLGANGAGKTTAIRILLDLIRPTRGQAWVFGRPLFAISPRDRLELRRRIGFIPGELRLYEDMTGRAFLDYLGSYFGAVRADWQRSILERLELDKTALSRKISGYSRGMKQKLGIVQALQHDPELLILDEPTEGLDPLMQQTFYGLLRELAGRGRTVFMSSHNLAEVEKICGRVAILRQGRLVAVEGIDTLQARRFHQVEVEFASQEEAAAFSVPGINESRREGGRLCFSWQGDFADLWAELEKYRIADFACQKASLEEIFLAYYGRSEENA